MCGICEYWMPVKNYEGLYEVSNFGNIKRLGNNKTKKEIIMKHVICEQKRKNKTYKSHKVILTKNKKRKTCMVHRLVWSAFNGDIPERYEIDHIDNNPENNCLFNLQLLTRMENEHKKYIDNSNYCAFNTPKKPIICIETGIKFESIRECSRQMKLYSQSICNHLKGKLKKTGGYHFKFLDE